MISFLRGTVLYRSGSTVTVDVGGVGYEVECSVRCLEALSPEETAEIIVYTDVREDSIRLFTEYCHNPDQFSRPQLTACTPGWVHRNSAGTIPAS